MHLPSPYLTSPSQQPFVVVVVVVVVVVCASSSYVFVCQRVFLIRGLENFRLETKKNK